MTEPPPPVILSEAPAERRISFCIAWNVFSSYQDKATLDATTLKLQIQNSQKTNSKSQNANSKHSISNYNFQETIIFSFVFIRVICGQSFFFRPLRGLVPCQADSFFNPEILFDCPGVSGQKNPIDTKPNCRSFIFNCLKYSLCFLCLLWFYLGSISDWGLRRN